MRHLKIVFTLMIVVVLSSVGVFAVEQITTPIIEQAQFEAENAALFEVFPALESSDDLTPEEGLNLEGTTITQVIEIDGKGYIYTAQFQGFQSLIKYMIGVDLEGTITGYQTLEQGDTPGYGAKIADPLFSNQFAGEALSSVGAGEFDGIAGATITTGGFTGSIQKLADFHDATFADGGGGGEETDPREEITSEGASFTDVTGDYDISGTPITKVEMVNDDEAVIYHVTFEGWQPDASYIIAFDLETHDVLGFRVIEHNETTGIGSLIAEDDFMAQFDGLAHNDALNGNIDSVSGATAPVTLSGLRDSLNEVTLFHQTYFGGGESDEEKLERLIGETFPSENSELREDVTADYPANESILNIFDIYNDDAERIGVVYYAEVLGNSYGDVADIKLLLVVEEGSIMSDVILFDDNETPSIFELNNLLNYHIAHYLTFLAPDEAALSAAYPDAVSFDSVYGDYPYSADILNVFEAKDESDNVLGYVYYAVASGFGGDITFTWGVDNAGITKQLSIVSHGESWNNAYPYSEDPVAGIFPNTSWLDQFEETDLSSINVGDIDDVAGVSTTTGGMKEAFAYIIEYHETNVGGAN
ncbi:MAG: FMN-binding protein [Candidatus Izemoplasmataceae bacterium]